jgi:hypothetical protein
MKQQRRVPEQPPVEARRLEADDGGGDDAAGGIAFDERDLLPGAGHVSIEGSDVSIAERRDE